MDNLSKTITISKVESKMFENGGTQYKITTTANEKFKFNDTKKEGGLTVASQQFKDMGIKVGSTVDVWYKEVQKEYEGKPYTDRLIATFRENNGEPIQQARPAPKTPVISNSSSTSLKYEPVQEKSQEFWDERGRRLALHGFINARLVNNPISQVELEIDQLLKLEDKINLKLPPSTNS